MFIYPQFFVFFNFSEKFGMHSVDFNDPNRPRTSKASSRFFKEIADNNGFVMP